MSEIVIRMATKDDQPHFLRLWRAMLEEIEGMGSDIEVVDANLETVLAHFLGYCSGALFWAAMVWYCPEGTPEGVVMSGEVAGSRFPFVSKHGTLSEAWGGYVSPRYRKQGILHTLQTALAKRLRHMGFDAMQTQVHPGNQASLAYADATGWEKVSTCYLNRFPADEEDS